MRPHCSTLCARSAWAAPPDILECHDLADELHQDARGDQCRDHPIEIEECGYDCQAADYQQGQTWKSAGMEFRERLEEVAVQRGGIGDARIAEHQREDRGESCP